MIHGLQYNSKVELINVTDNIPKMFIRVLNDRDYVTSNGQTKSKTKHNDNINLKFKCIGSALTCGLGQEKNQMAMSTLKVRGVINGGLCGLALAIFL